MKNILRVKSILKVGYLLIFFFASRLVLLFFFSETPSLFINHYEKAAINFLNGNGFSVLYENSFVPLTLYPPGYSFIISFVYKLFGINPVAVQLFQIIVSCLAFYLFIKTIVIFFKSEEQAIRYGYLYILFPIFWTSDVSLNTGASLAISFTLISFYFLFGTNCKLQYSFGGLFLACAVSVRSEFIILLPVFLFCIFFSSKRISYLLLFTSGCVFVLAPMSIRNYRNFNVISPLPGGGGLALINVIGKFYPDYQKGFAFGDGNILKAEKGNYKDLTYPMPYEREKDRLNRSIKFVVENPGKFVLVLVKNTPRAWFGHQINLIQGPGFQEYLTLGGGYSDFIKKYPLKFLDIFFGFSLSFLLFMLFIYFIINSNKELLLRFLPLMLSGGVFFIFFIALGTLGRYTLPAYVLIAPLSYLGLNIMLDKLKKRKEK